MNVVIYIGSSRQLIGWTRYDWRSTKRKEIERWRESCIDGNRWCV